MPDNHELAGADVNPRPVSQNQETPRVGRGGFPLSHSGDPERDAYEQAYFDDPNYYGVLNHNRMPYEDLNHQDFQKALDREMRHKYEDVNHPNNQFMDENGYWHYDGRVMPHATVYDKFGSPKDYAVKDFNSDKTYHDTDGNEVHYRTSKVYQTVDPATGDTTYIREAPDALYRIRTQGVLKAFMTPLGDTRRVDYMRGLDKQGNTFYYIKPGPTYKDPQGVRHERREGATYYDHNRDITYRWVNGKPVFLKCGKP